jgi:predicted RND superfamily exporter protein
MFTYKNQILLFRTMKKDIIPIITVSVTVFLAGCAGNIETTNKTESPNNQTQEQVEKPKTINEYSDSKNGINLEITKITKQDGKTIIEATFNNHVYNLEETLNSESAMIDQTKASDYELLVSTNGGHHVEARWTFETEGSQIQIQATKTVEFTFSIN